MIARSDFLQDLDAARRCGSVSEGMSLLSAYAGAKAYLLMRTDTNADETLSFVVTSDWPFDLVRGLGADIASQQARSSEIRRCLQAFDPVFVEAPARVVMPEGIGRRICVLPFNSGPARMALSFLFEEGEFLSHDRLRDVAVAAAWHSASFPDLMAVSNLLSDLTEREIECLAWIGEGKTSDEIALIIGISRNTVNNYITSIMNKTGARTRSEAVAFAVRNRII